MHYVGALHLQPLLPTYDTTSFYAHRNAGRVIHFLYGGQLMELQRRKFETGTYTFECTTISNDTAILIDCVFDGEMIEKAMSEYLTFL